MYLQIDAAFTSLRTVVSLDRLNLLDRSGFGYTSDSHEHD